MPKLTIVLTLYDRGNYYDYPMRWMTFADKHLNQFKIIIADGTGNKKIEKYFKNKKNFPKSMVQYIKYKKDKNYRDYFVKLSDCISRVKTKYTILADDDDFYSYNGLKKSIEFLEKNKEFIACRGLIGVFKITKFKLGNIYIPKIQKSLVHNTASKRCKGIFFEDILPVFYDVHLTKNQIKNFRLLNKSKFIEPTMVEMLPEFLDAIDGKIARIPELYLMRQSGNNNSAHHKYVSKNGGILKRLSFGNFSNDLKIWVKVVSKALSKRDKVSEKVAYEYLTSLFVNSLQIKFKKEFLVNKNKNYSMSNLKKIIKLFIPIYFLNKYLTYKNKTFEKKLLSNNKFLKDIDNHLKLFKEKK